MIYDRFYDVAVLRYKISDTFSRLNLRQKRLVYYLSQAAAYGRDITYDQNCSINLPLRTVLEEMEVKKDEQYGPEFLEYLKCFYAYTGIHHPYNEIKIVPKFPRDWFVKTATKRSRFYREVSDRMKWQINCALFDSDYLPVRTSHDVSGDLLLDSSVNLYSGVTEDEAKKYYSEHNPEGALNSRLCKNQETGEIYEEKYKVGGRYSWELSKIVENLEEAKKFAENEQQEKVLENLILYYKTGDISYFNQQCIEWVKDTDSEVDFINGFIEVYLDPLGKKGAWESLVEIVDKEGTEMTKKLSDNAQWFEDHSPIDQEFKKALCTGLSSKSIAAAFLGGSEYPMTAIGICLPNQSWIREQFGSKSVTLTNIVREKSEFLLGLPEILEKFYYPDQLELLKKYSSRTSEVFVNLHECLGHGSGKLRPGITKADLHEYGSVIEEARADLFALYYIADPKMVELGLLPTEDAYEIEYVKYLTDGLFIQLSNLPAGSCSIEEAHMRNRMLISTYAREWNKVHPFMEIKDRKIAIFDYQELRICFGELLREIQRITSLGDYSSAAEVVSEFCVIEGGVEEVNAIQEIFKGAPKFRAFVNPDYVESEDCAGGGISDIVCVDGTEDFLEQNLRYSKYYSKPYNVNDIK